MHTYFAVRCAVRGKLGLNGTIMPLVADFRRTAAASHACESRSPDVDHPSFTIPLMSVSDRLTPLDLSS